MKRIYIVIWALIISMLLPFCVFAKESEGVNLLSSKMLSSPRVDGVINTNEYKGAALYEMKGSNLNYYGHKTTIQELWDDNELFYRDRIGDSKIYVGWTTTGLYVACKIADKTISKTNFNSDWYNTFYYGKEPTNGFVGESVTLLLRLNGDKISNTQSAGEGGYQNMIAFTAIPFPREGSSTPERNMTYAPVVYESWITHKKLNVDVAVSSTSNDYTIEYYIPFEVMETLTIKDNESGEDIPFSGMTQFTDGGKLYFSMLLSDGIEYTTLMVTDSSNFDPTEMGGFSFDDCAQDKTVEEVRQTLNSFTSEVNTISFIEKKEAKISFNTDGGYALDDLKVYSGDVISLNKYIPTKPGYKFVTWCTDKELNNPISELTVTTNTTLYAKYTRYYSDVNDNDYFHDAVYWADKLEITNGTSIYKFSPNENCTRGQIVTFLWRAAGCPEPSTTVNPFVDVKETSYYYKAVLWAVEKGITNGADETHFNPNAYCTRSQAVTFMYRAEGQPSTSGENIFKDVSNSSYYYNAVIWAVEKCITNGTTATRFSPNEYCTRGQIVTFLYRNK